MSTAWSSRTASFRTRRSQSRRSLVASGSFTYIPYADLTALRSSTAGLLEQAATEASIVDQIATAS